MITFPKPKGFRPPEGLKEGDSFEVLATCRARGENSIELLEIDGLPVSQEKSKKEPKDMGDRLDAGVDALTGGGPGAIPREMMVAPPGRPMGGGYGA